MDNLIEKAAQELNDCIILGDMNARNSENWVDDNMNAKGHALHNTFT